MELSSKNIQLQYQGYLNTPLLWKDHAVLGLKQYELPKQLQKTLIESIPEYLLLGKRVEQFVLATLHEQSNIEILLENTQIQNQKITIGEIDCLLKQDGTPLHLEIVYKFYLYDSSIGNTEIDHWIGPNRRDTLVKKLHKLKDKQLPLIHNVCTKPILQTFNLDAKDIKQSVCFKAQLFTPYQATVDFDLLNKDCLKGFYIHTSELEQFSGSKFYMPIKIDWLIEVQSDVQWMSYDQFSKKIRVIIDEKRAPLCWIKFPNGVLQKFFVVWWRNNESMRQ